MQAAAGYLEALFEERLFARVHILSAACGLGVGSWGRMGLSGRRDKRSIDHQQWVMTRV